MEYSGVAKNWPSQRSEFKRFAEYSARFGEKVRNDLANYASTGEVVSNADSPNFPKWQSTYLYLALEMRALELNQRGQIEAVQNVSASPLLGLSFAYARVSKIIELQIHEDFPRRFPGRKLQAFSMQQMACWVATGFSVGCGEAEQLGRLALNAVRREFCFDLEFYPIFHFVLLMFASSQGIRVDQMPSAATREPPLTSLLEEWRNPDVDVLAPLVRAVCDFHTHRWKARTKDWNEFGSGVGSNFIRMPIEILLLYRLREREGLRNPEVDHPLMNSPIGKLCRPLRCEPDNLLRQVLDRAMSQGFDENAIIQRMLS
ncbi:MAG: hypothetical protein HC814_00030 [Rhodobacteraceae bacterium]|nr:hypothetical protein [Paracoccaceae bacterium]